MTLKTNETKEGGFLKIVANLYLLDLVYFLFDDRKKLDYHSYLRTLIHGINYESLEYSADNTVSCSLPPNPRSTIWPTVPTDTVWDINNNNFHHDPEIMFNLLLQYYCTLSSHYLYSLY